MNCFLDYGDGYEDGYSPDYGYQGQQGGGFSGSAANAGAQTFNGENFKTCYSQ